MSIDNTMTIFHDLTPEDVRGFRSGLRMSQRQLAGALGISIRAIEEWEGGRRTPPHYLRLALERLAITRAAATGDTAPLDMAWIREILAIAKQLT